MMMLVADVAVAEDADVMASVMTIMEVVVLVAMDHVVPLVVDLVPLEPISNDYQRTNKKHQSHHTIFIRSCFVHTFVDLESVYSMQTFHPLTLT